MSERLNSRSMTDVVHVLMRPYDYDIEGAERECRKSPQITPLEFAQQAASEGRFSRAYSFLIVHSRELGLSGVVILRDACKVAHGKKIDQIDILRRRVAADGSTKGTDFWEAELPKKAEEIDRLVKTLDDLTKEHTEV